MRVLIVPDSFKGTFTAPEVAARIGSGWSTARPKDDLDLLPMSDGGEGFGAVMAELLAATPRTADTVDPDHRPVTATWWWHGPTRTAVIESAEVVGLARFGPGDPRRRDTLGLAALLEAADGAGAGRIVVGLGGSATNDGGFGLARGLGWEFRDGSAAAINRWTDLGHLGSVAAGSPIHAEVIAATDVTNPLLGPSGCSRVFGPQKGLTRPDLAEACLIRLADVVDADAARIPGAGAAGGLGFGLAAFAGASLRSGFAIFARTARLEERIAAADLVITGEGGLDGPSLMGKGVGEVAARARQRGVPCLAIVGRIDDPEAAAGFETVYPLDGIALEIVAQRAAAARGDRGIGG